MAANYRAANRARSYADFTSKMGIAAEEADETLFWLGVTIDGGVNGGAEAETLRTEARELLAICAASHKTAKGRLAAQRR